MKNSRNQCCCFLVSGFQRKDKPGMLFFVWLVSVKWVCVILFFYGYIFLLPLVLCDSCIPWNFKMQTFFSLFFHPLLSQLSLQMEYSQSLLFQALRVENCMTFKWELQCKQMLPQNFTSQSLRQETCYEFVNISFSHQSTWHVTDRLQQFYETILALPSMSF